MKRKEKEEYKEALSKWKYYPRKVTYGNEKWGKRDLKFVTKAYFISLDPNIGR